jgi:malonate-semialdehyde dehydrogenase (acetylating)/methylmalonate-semialdehyde dehydrogenase
MELLSHWISNAKHTSVECLAVTTPHTNEVIAQVPMATVDQVNQAVQHSHTAFTQWKGLTTKTRSILMSNFYTIVMRERTNIATLIVREHGKTFGEALAEVDKGCETIVIAK